MPTKRPHNRPESPSTPSKAPLKVYTRLGACEALLGRLVELECGCVGRIDVVDGQGYPQGTIVRAVCGGASDFWLYAGIIDNCYLLDTPPEP